MLSVNTSTTGSPPTQRSHFDGQQSAFRRFHTEDFHAHSLQLTVFSVGNCPPCRPSPTAPADVSQPGPRAAAARHRLRKTGKKVCNNFLLFTNCFERAKSFKALNGDTKSFFFFVEHKIVRVVPALSVKLNGNRPCDSRPTQTGVSVGR